MKIHRLSKFVGISVLSLSIGILPLMLPTSAQNNTEPGTSTDNNTNDPGEMAADESGDRDFDWGWLGLIGLAGLAGLKGGKKQEATTQYRDPNTVGSRSSTR